MQSQSVNIQGSKNILISVYLTGSKFHPHIFTVDRSINLSTFVKTFLSKCPDLQSVKEITHSAILILSEIEYNINNWAGFSFDTHLQYLQFEFCPF